MGAQYDLFIIVLNMSVTATYMAIFVWILRLLLKRAPKIFFYVLWIAVLVRLISPYSFSSSLNLIGQFAPVKQLGNETVSLDYIPYEIGYAKEPKVDVGIGSVNQVINQMLPEATPYVSINPMQGLIWLISVIWVFGVVILLGYSIISYLNIKRKMNTAMLLRDNIYESDQISTPFVLGFIRPRIYLPLGIMEKERDYIIGHEQVHLKRLDHIIKPFAFILLTIHWFNPVIWISYSLMSKDMEMSCDERVLKECGNQIKKEYGSSLLRLATREKMICGTPLAFGESNTKGRIKNVLSYQKPKKWIMVVIGIVCVGCLYVLISNPKVESAQGITARLAEELLQHKTQYVGDNSKVSALITTVKVPSGTEKYEFALQTAQVPYEVNIQYKMSYDLYVPKDNELLRNSILLFATIDNVDIISHVGIWSHQDIAYHSFEYIHTREEVDALLGKNVGSYAKSQSGMEELIVIANRMLLSKDYDYITNFTNYVGNHSVGLAEFNNKEIATAMVELLLAGEGKGLLVDYNLPLTSDYIKIEIGEQRDRIFYVFEDNNQYYALSSQEGQWEIAEKSYRGILGLFTTIAEEVE